MAQNPWDMKWEATPAPKAGSQAASSAAPWEMNWEAQKQVSRDKPTANTPGYLETADIALGDGITFQNRDELEGAGAVLTTPSSWAASLGLTKGPTIRDVYIAKRDEERRRSEAARLANPKTYDAANFTGAVIPTTLGVIASGGTAAPLLATAAVTTAMGVAYGSGSSNADNPTDVALDALEGGAYGLAGGLAGRALASPQGQTAVKAGVERSIDAGKSALVYLASGAKNKARQAWSAFTWAPILYGTNELTGVLNKAITGSDRTVGSYIMQQGGFNGSSGGNK